MHIIVLIRACVWARRFWSHARISVLSKCAVCHRCLPSDDHSNLWFVEAQYLLFKAQHLRLFGPDTRLAGELL